MLPLLTLDYLENTHSVAGSAQLLNKPAKLEKNYQVDITIKNPNKKTASCPSISITQVHIYPLSTKYVYCTC